jgi:uncharacterized membrane protein YphA (DoxX/SURF4 family)
VSRLRSLAVLLCALLVGGTYIVAGVLKSLDVVGFARDIALHGIIGNGLSAVAARVLIPFEIAVGAAAILGYRRRWAFVLLAASLVLFIGATGWAWAHGNTEGCGCFGRYAERTPLTVIVEDAFLLVACAIGFLLTPRQAAATAAQAAAAASTAAATGRWRGAVVAALTVAAAAFALASPHLPIDGIATALRPGATLSDLGLAQIAGNLDQGERLLVILVLDEEPSRKAVEGLNALAQAPGALPISGLTSAPEDKRAEFFFTYGPTFELLEVPSADLRRLYRRAPRVFRVHNGAVLRVWDTIPSVEELNR